MNNYIVSVKSTAENRLHVKNAEIGSKVDVSSIEELSFNTSVNIIDSEM